MNHSEIKKFLTISTFFNSLDLGFESEKFFSSVFGRYFADPDQKEKFLQIQRIRYPDPNYWPKLFTII